jgi:signal transduction histidine kinase
MVFRSKHTALAIGLVALMGGTLAVLAVMQYHWISDVGVAERTRLRASLENALKQFRTEFNVELRRVCVDLQMESEDLATHNLNRIIERYGVWLAEEHQTKLVEDVFLLTVRPDGKMESQWLDVQEEQWLPAGWPLRLDRIRRNLNRRLPGRRPGPSVEVSSQWVVMPGDLALAQPLFAQDPGTGATDTAGFLVLALDRQYFQGVFLLEMLRRYFPDQAGSDFEAAVLLGTEPGEIVSGSGIPPDARLLSAPELRAPLLWDHADPPAISDGSASHPSPDPIAQRTPAVPFLWVGEANDWVIVATYRGGSLEEIVARSRRRSLAVSFGVLLLLGAGMTVIVLGARRAHRLADLQMKFVAGVSHDLRTPLAVICAAADNLAEGVIDSANLRVKEYGILIRTEGRKLKAMVEQTLDYAGLQSGSRKMDLQPVEIAGIVNAVLTDEEPTIKSLGMAVEVDIPSGIPAVLCNRAALQQAIRNLVVNSLKYAAAGHWMRIRAEVFRGSGKNEVAVSVEDRGPGIDAADLPHIFEPFYRGRNAEAAGVPGSGLGLSVVDQGISALGGRVEARSTPGSGSTFNLFLPAVRNAAVGDGDKP